MTFLNELGGHAECEWCHGKNETKFIFCAKCMADTESFQDRWNIAAEIEGKKIVCSECGGDLSGTQELACGMCVSCMWWI